MLRSETALPVDATVSTRPFAYTDRHLAVDGVSLDSLALQYGTPLYVYSASNVRHRLALFTEAFAAIPHTLCYAVKANSSLALLQLLGRLGTGFDIVSGGELERVRRACPTALERVVFSGVGKQGWEIDAALEANILLFNVESVAELQLLNTRAAALGKVARFALRVNPDVFAETHPYISTGLREHKFGIDLRLARNVYQQASRYKSLRATGVSVHIGSQIRDTRPFYEAIARVATLIQELREDGHEITHIDAGGGLGIDYTASLGATEPLTPEEQVTSYAAALREPLRDLHCHLLLEPGRFLVAQAGGLLSRVLGIKQNGSKRFVITDAAMNDLIRPALYQAHHEIVPVLRRPEEDSTVASADAPVDVVGPVCESGDCFAHDRMMPSLASDDLVVFLDAGAYGMSQASNYNSRPRPAEVLIDDGVAHLIRRRETMDDLLATERLL